MQPLSAQSGTIVNKDEFHLRLQITSPATSTPPRMYGKLDFQEHLLTNAKQQRVLNIRCKKCLSAVTHINRCSIMYCVIPIFYMGMYSKIHTCSLKFSYSCNSRVVLVKCFNLNVSRPNYSPTICIADQIFINLRCHIRTFKGGTQTQTRPHEQNLTFYSD